MRCYTLCAMTEIFRRIETMEPRNQKIYFTYSEKQFLIDLLRNQMEPEKTAPMIELWGDRVNAIAQAIRDKIADSDNG